MDANTPDRLLLDVGVVAVDGVVIGATRGGIEWSLNRTIRNMEADGMIGDTKGFKRRESVRPTLSINSLEMKQDTLAHYVAGARLTYTSGLITVGTVVAGNTITINDLTYTAVAGAPSGYQFQIGATADDTATNLRARLIDATYGVPGVTATVLLDEITLTANPRRFNVIGSANLVFTTSGQPAIQGGSIRPGDFKGAVTVTGKMSNSATVTITLTNCIAEGDWSVNQADSDEAVVNPTFVAHVTEDMVEPWSIDIT